MNDLYSQFLQPSAAFRGKPFWSWNGELKQDELIRQVHIMRQMGMGGFFMHSRSGLITEYLGEKWFELINACADEAEKIGLEAWLYDEDRWPSGTAAGLVTQNPAYRSRYLRLSVIPTSEFHWQNQIYAAFVCKLEGQNFSACSRIIDGEEMERLGGETALVFTIEEMEPSSFYNGFTYVDTLQREATEEFIRLTHEAHKAKCGDRLGRSIKGIFTDEPHRGAVMNGFSLSNPDSLYLAPWTENLATNFEAKFGDDFIAQLPNIFLQRDGEAVSPAKWQYMELLQEMFLENFARPLFDWCEENNLRLTGHVLHEISLTTQVCMQGSLMRFYELMHDPGIDILSGCNRKYWAAKQATSVARQLGQKWILSELYGCTGWERTFADHRQIGHWQALFGINVRCHHLSWYTMEGEAKRDYPASIFHQSAWWQEYHHVETYFARLHVLLAQGEPVCDILVVTPIESVNAQIHAGWAQHLSARDEPVQDLERGYEELFFMLVGGHLDFDYGDEEMMGRLASVEKDGKGGPVLRVGKTRYRVVVLGRMTTIRSSTLQLLEDFLAAGGQVIHLGEAPPYVDAERSERASNLAKTAVVLPWNAEILREKCEELVSERVEITSVSTGQKQENVFCQLRRDGEKRILVAMNMDEQEEPFEVQIRVSGEGVVTEWNCLTGERFLVPSEQRDGYIQFEASFHPADGHAYLLEKEATEKGSSKPQLTEIASHTLKGPFAFQLQEPNVCVLDMARYKIGDSDWEDEMEILKVDRAVRSHFDRPFRSGDMIQPWFQEKFHPAAKEILAGIQLSFEFFIEEMPTSPLFLAMERPELWAASLNGGSFDTEVEGWWVDTAFQKIAVPLEQLRLGSNRITLEAEFYESMNLEALYLLGDFGVHLDSSKKKLTHLPNKLAVGDIVPQGLPFYGGALQLHLPLPVELEVGQTALFKTGKFEAACLKVGSGQNEKLLGWAPYEADVTDLIQNSEFELEVILTRRNTFGPLHQVPVRSGSYGPGNFVTQGEGFSADYGLIENGLLSAPEIKICVSK